MRKLSLDRAWKLCLEQWEWIIGELDKGSEKDISALKTQWLNQRRYKDRPYGDCFFCEHHRQNPETTHTGFCKNCPAFIVSKGFYCMNKSYSYHDNPRAFYRKIKALNKKRLAK